MSAQVLFLALVGSYSEIAAMSCRQIMESRSRSRFWPPGQGCGTRNTSEEANVVSGTGVIFAPQESPTLDICHSFKRTNRLCFSSAVCDPDPYSAQTCPNIVCSRQPVLCKIGSNLCHRSEASSRQHPSRFREGTPEDWLYSSSPLITYISKLTMEKVGGMI